MRSALHCLPAPDARPLPLSFLSPEQLGAVCVPRKHRPAAAVAGGAIPARACQDQVSCARQGPWDASLAGVWRGSVPAASRACPQSLPLRLPACSTARRVPRLDGGKLGAFATRSPHRPCPIGLSVARVVGVEGRTLVLGGADIVDGSPVLDIKPYVPFADVVPSASAPHWVAAVKVRWLGRRRPAGWGCSGCTIWDCSSYLWCGTPQPPLCHTTLLSPPVAWG